MVKSGRSIGRSSGGRLPKSNSRIWPIDTSNLPLKPMVYWRLSTNFGRSVGRSSIKPSAIEPGSHNFSEFRLDCCEQPFDPDDGLLKIYSHHQAVVVSSADTADGNECVLIQHISQLNFMLKAVKPVEDKPFRVGFGQ
jgi:hypothetical protein